MSTCTLNCPRQVSHLTLARGVACSSGHRQRFGQTPPLGQLEEVVDGADAVSYTHLDVYKRQKNPSSLTIWESLRFKSGGNRYSARHLLEVEATNVLPGARSGGALCHVFGISFEEGNQLFQILRRQVLSRHDHIGIARQQGDRIEIPQHIVLQRTSPR